MTLTHLFYIVAILLSNERATRAEERISALETAQP